MQWHDQGNGAMSVGGFSNDGYLNAAIYPPGIVCLAMPGCPVNPICCSVVTWYPGKETLMLSFGSLDESKAWVEYTIR